MSEPENTRSQDYRVMYANTFGIAFADGDIRLTFGIQKNPGSNDISMEEQCAVMFSHAAIKLLSLSLTAIIADFEAATGREIFVDPDKLKSLNEAIEAVRAARRAAKAGA